MVAQAGSDTSGKTLADKFCVAVVISILLGLGLPALLLVINNFFPRHRFGSTFSQVFQICLLISILFVYLIAPLLGIFAFVALLRNWRPITRRDDVSHVEGQTRKIARRFLSAAELFAISSLLPIFFFGSAGEYVKHSSLACFLDIWFTMPALLALVMGCISYKLFAKTSGRVLARIGALFAITIGSVIIVFSCTTNFVPYLVQRIKYSTRTETFTGSSDSLKHTVIVPTLDSPIQPGKNIIWCSSFQLSWNELRDNVVHEPVVLTDGQELANLLNNAMQTRDDIEPTSCFIATGLIGKGVDKYIKTEMSRKFPGEPVPNFNDLLPLDLVMYAFLTAEVKFKHPFENYRSGLIFTDSRGHKSEVAAFGVWDDSPRYNKLRSQVTVLYQSPSPESKFSSLDPNAILAKRHLPFLSNITEFALDLCRFTQPYQVILARIDPQPTLALTVADLQAKISDFFRRQDYEDLREFNKGDKLYVPEMFWRVEHRFADLEGKTIFNPGFGPYPIKRAEQMIHFRLDRCGAVLKSRATLVVALGRSIGRRFSFDRPFLIYMKKRDCEQPFFVMWVDSAELLTKK